jgi:hypothetical protein
MHNLYQNIVAKFEDNKHLFSDALLEPIQTIDFYMGQPAAPNAFEFSLPAIFVDYAIDWENNVITIEAHCLSEFMEDTENFSHKREQGLEYMRRLAIVRRLLTNTATQFITGLKPTNERPATTEYFHYHILSFQASIQPYTDTDIIPPSMTDIEISGRLDKHEIKEKEPTTSAGSLDIDFYK